MADDPLAETRDFWNRVASDWRIQVGEDGDVNRRLNSDPVLWKFIGKVRGLRVLDAGCGTGYLTKKLHDSGAEVTGIDFSEKMIEAARNTNPALDFHVDSCSELRSIQDASIELLVSNYVIMDTPDLSGTLSAFGRVLVSGGIAVLVFSHPCFPGARAYLQEDGLTTTYRWPEPYFEPHRCIDPPWAHFKEEFIWFHRPLSEYWKAFSRAGFEVRDFDEPHASPEVLHDFADEAAARRSVSRPYSVAFKLRKG